MKWLVWFCTKCGTWMFQPSFYIEHAHKWCKCEFNSFQQETEIEKLFLRLTKIGCSHIVAWQWIMAKFLFWFSLLQGNGCCFTEWTTNLQTDGYVCNNHFSGETNWIIWKLNCLWSENGPLHIWTTRNWNPYTIPGKVRVFVLKSFYLFFFVHDYVDMKVSVDNNPIWKDVILSTTEPVNHQQTAYV